jgi:hypothetical protein
MARTHATQTSITDPEARMYQQARGQQATMCYLGHALMEHRYGVVVGTCVTQATGTGEREAAQAMLGGMAGRHRVTLGADEQDDTRDFVRELRGLRAKPMWHSRPVVGPVPLMGTPPATPAMLSVSRSANGSKRVSAG